jgi:hypothetical protein
MTTKLGSYVRQNPVDVTALCVSAMAACLSLATFFAEPIRQSDQLTSGVIKEAYASFMSMNDVRTEHPYQSHLFELSENYEQIAASVATATQHLRNSPHEIARLLLEERSVADRLFTMFEESYYQWQQAQASGDTPRAEFLLAVVDYFTGRLLRNPRLLWYWSPNGGALAGHYEADTVAYYDANVKQTHENVDSEGPFQMRSQSSINK